MGVGMAGSSTSSRLIAGRLGVLALGLTAALCQSAWAQGGAAGKPDIAPEPPVVKPPTTQRVPSVVLTSKAISLPQPAYPIMAKQTGTHGAVNIQILVDEQGKVISAQVVSGSPMLTTAAKEAAMRARFTPTILNGQPVKIQGVIIYNFVLQ